MKMVKSLLLGSAAGLVAVAGAQAADLPVKAKPVEYVKICSIYGAGFFYIPGTDTCIKIGGWVRAEYGFQTGNSSVQYNQGAGGRNNRIDSNEYNMRARWTTSIDVRTQTEYGTLRAYSRAGFQTTTGETAQGRIYTERGFIQFAGFTFGKSQSYFDFFGGAFCYGCSYTGTASMTGAAGTLLAAYTATFGNGFTATISLEDQLIRRNAIWDASNDATNALVISNMPGPASAADSYNFVPVNMGDHAATGIPDIVGSLRVDQAWGSAQIAGALHQLRAGYYGNNTTGAGANVLGVDSRFLSPSDAYGWAVMAGIVINLPWAKGDKFYVEASFAEGAGAYVGLDGGISGKNNNFGRFNGANVAAAWAIDSVFGTLVSTNGATSQQLTRYFSIHGCDRALLDSGTAQRSSGATTRPRTTTTSRRRCSARRRRARSAVSRLRTPRSRVRRLSRAATRTSTPGRSACARSGTRHRSSMSASKCTTRRLETKHDPNTVALNFAGAGGRPAGVYLPSSDDVWGSILRLQRNFWP